MHEIDGLIIDLNQRACDSLGYTREEMLDMPVGDVELEFTQEGTGRVWEPMAPGVTLTLEGTHRRKDNATFPVEVRLGKFYSQGRPLFLALARDVTERKRLEEELLQAQKMEAIGRLAGGMAHDFNNLLTPIISYAELSARTRPPDDRLKTYLPEIRKAADHAADLTRQLLAFSRRQIIEPKVVELNDLVLNMDRMLRRLIGEDIELVTLPAPKLSLVEVDHGQIEQVLVNLVVNARDAMPDGGRLVIEIGDVDVVEENAPHHPPVAAGKYVTISVSDTGVGMTDEFRAHVFDPFYTTKEPGKGTGLGLSTCYGIVKQARGHISVSSEPGRGSSFKMHLPRVETSNYPARLQDDSDFLPTGNETVLLVEDEPAVGEVAARVLREQGYTVLEAANGDEALGVAQSQGSGQIDLLLTDVIMPLMGGRELADQLRQTHPETRVLYTSGYMDDTVIHRGPLEADVGFMEKPFSPAILARKVREVLER